MRSKLVSSILCLILGTAILLPAAKRLAHAIYEHSAEKVCDNPSALHIHQTEVDCEFQKFYPSIQFLPNLATAQIPQKLVFSKVKTPIYNRLTGFLKLHFSLRAPPTLS